MNWQGELNAPYDVRCPTIHIGEVVETDAGRVCALIDGHWLELPPIPKQVRWRDIDDNAKTGEWIVCGDPSKRGSSFPSTHHWSVLARYRGNQFVTWCGEVMRDYPKKYCPLESL